MSLEAYHQFLRQKAIVDPPAGIDPPPLCAALFLFQKDIVTWALRRGRAAIFNERDRAARGGDAWPYETWVSILIWQRYASPVWMDIDQHRTLQYRSARDEKDEAHISPLQLDVIERCIDLWSMPGDTVLTPFLGIGSEVYAAVEMGRRGIGFELKPSYFAQAVKNLREATARRDAGSLLSLMEATP